MKKNYNLAPWKSIYNFSLAFLVWRFEPYVLILRRKKCAEMMASYEPWKRLGRGYTESLRIIKDPSREVYLALVEGKIFGFIVLEMSGAFIGLGVTQLKSLFSSVF